MTTQPQSDTLPSEAVEAERLDAIAVMMGEFVDNWPNPKRFDTALKLVAKTIRILLDPPEHKYWGAGETDCPRDIKAGNGELHTLRCKVCGEDNPQDQRCLVKAALTEQSEPVAKPADDGGVVEALRAVVAEADCGIKECPVNNPALSTGSQSACTKCGHGPDRNCPSIDGANYRAVQIAREALANRTPPSSEVEPVSADTLLRYREALEWIAYEPGAGDWKAERAQEALEMKHEP